MKMNESLVQDSERTLTPDPIVRNEALWALAYFAVYMFYLVHSLEGEFLHWISLVTIPIACVYIRRSISSSPHRIREILNSFGIDRSTLRNGLGWAALIGLLLCGLQFFLSRNSDRILELILSGKALYLFPLSLLLMLFLAGSTEEFFFRGFLQTRLQALFSSKVVAVVITSVLFGLYHVPYAYLNARWPSHGDFTQALWLACAQGIPMGLILGTVYVRTNNNLLASILIHSLVNSLPAMLSIKFGNAGT